MPLASRGRATRRLTLTPRGWCVAGVGACALLGGWLARYPGLVGIGIACVVAAIVSLLGLGTRSGVEVTRELPTKPVRRLSELDAGLQITLASGAPGAEVEIREHIDGQALSPVVRQLERSVRVDYSIPTTLPGSTTIGPAELRFTGFAGLARLRLVDVESESVIVLARSLPVRLPDSGLIPVEAPRADEVEGGGTELRALRPYVPGDDLRRVSARVSARVGKLMIRQDAEPSISSLTLVVDNSAALDPEDYAEMLDVATSIVGSAVTTGVPLRWTARGRQGLANIDADGLAGTEMAIACLPMTEDSLPIVAGADLTIAVCGPHTSPGELAARVADGADHRMLIVLQIEGAGQAADADRTAGHPGDTAGVLVLAAPTAEMLLRKLSHAERILAGAF